MFALSRSIYYLPAPAASSVYGILYYDCGSRCDWAGHEGITHFLEHALFKGARHLSARQLFERIERYGGELNAFTTKDKMAIEFSVPPTALRTALEIVRLIAEEATLLDTTVEKERQVILEELAMYEDIPEEALLDRYEEMIFSVGGLRHPIIGYRTSLLATDGEVLRRYYREVFQRSPWVLLVGGAVSGRAVEGALRQTGWLAKASPTERLWRANEAPHVLDAPLLEKRPTQQSHLVVGGLGPSPYQQDGLALQLILQALGGPFMSSVLNLLLRERYGWGYSVYSFYHGYAEKGVWGIYAGLMPDVAERALRLIQRKLAEWQARPISAAHLRALKNQFWGRQMILWERLSYRLQVQGRWLLDKGHPLEESRIKAQLFSLSGEELWAAARRYFSPQWVAILQPLQVEGIAQ